MCALCYFQLILGKAHVIGIKIVGCKRRPSPAIPDHVNLAGGNRSMPGMENIDPLAFRNM